MSPVYPSRRWGNVHVTTDFQLFRFTSTQGRFHLWDLFFLLRIFKLESLSDWIGVPWTKRNIKCNFSFSILLRTKGGDQKHHLPVSGFPLGDNHSLFNFWVHLNKSPCIGSRTEAWYRSLYLTELVIFFYYFPFWIGRFALGNEGGIFVLCKGYIFVRDLS